MATTARPTIGILLNDPVTYASYMRFIWAGAMMKAEAEDVDLVCFQGRQAEKSTTYLQQNLTLFSQICPGVIDGLVVVGMTEQVLWDCIPAARTVPTVTVQPSQFPHIVADNDGGMRAGVEHLIRDHHRRRLAFVRGITGEPGGEARYRTFVEVLRECGLPLDPALVYQGDYLTASGVGAVEELVARRRVEFDAVVAANDLMAYGVLQGLAAHGRTVPREVSVIGFDDFDKSAFCEPPLTTVHQPLQEMGSRAVEMILAALRGTRINHTEVVPTRLVKRRSCGCLSPAIVNAFAAAPPPGRIRALFAGTASPSAISAALTEALRTRGEEGVAGLTVEWTRRLAGSLAKDLETASGAFLDAIEEFVRDLVVRRHSPSTAQEALSVFRRESLPVLAAHSQHLARAEGLWQQARVLIDAAGQRPFLAAQASIEGEAETIESMLRALSTKDGVRGLLTTLLPKLIGLGVRNAYVALHDDRSSPARRSRLVMAYHEGQAVPLDPQGEPFDTSQLLPARFRARSRRCALLVNPTFFSFADNDQLGFTVFDLTLSNMRLRTALGDQLAGPIRNALVVEGVSGEVRKREAVKEQTERELRAFLHVINALSEGDLTLRCQEGATLGRIGRSINAMIARFSAILAETREAARSISLAATRIHGAANDITAGAQEGTDQVHAMMAAVHEMAASMDEVSRHAELSASKAETVSAHAQTSDRAMDAAFAAVTKLDAAVEETAGKMRSLEERIHAIFGTVESIDKIARQARLLSLNAAIQASRAGEAGRSFAVVAEELRLLTDNTAQATKSITQNLEAVIGETAPVTDALSRALHDARDGSRLSEEARKNLHQITSLIEMLTQVATQIAKASREQTYATQTVASGMETIASVSVHSTSSAADTSKAVEHLVALAGDLNRAISRFRIGDVSLAAKHPPA